MSISPQILALIIIIMPILALPAAFLFRRRHRWLNLSTILVSLFSLISSLLLVDSVLAEPLRFAPFSFLPFYLDSLSIYFVLLVNLVAFFASIYAIPFLRHDQARNPSHNPAEFHTLLNLFHLTMLLVPMVDNLVVLWIAIELTTIFSTLLVRYQRNRLAIEASWKFMIITTTGVIFALLGTLFLMYAVVNSAPAAALGITADQAMHWSIIARPENSKVLSSNFVILSFLFILIGYGTKAGLAPMHAWLPDGHGEAPSPVSALLSGVMLKSALYAILRFYTITNLNQANKNLTSTLMILMGLLSLVLATPFILKKNKFKRILAYHSLEHMGIITFGIGIGTPIALFGALLHSLNHALTKALMFLVFGSIQYQHLEAAAGQDQVDSSEPPISGVLKSMPFYGTILAFGGLALVGSPPFSIFMSEFFILWAAIQSIIAPPGSSLSGALLVSAVVLFVLTITLIFGGLVGHLSSLLLGKPMLVRPEPYQPFSARAILLGAPFVVLLSLLLIFGLGVPSWPVDLPLLLKKSVDILQYGALP